MHREFILQALRDDVRAARKRFDDTAEYLDLAIHGRSKGCRNTSRRERIRWTSRSYAIAGRELQAALERLHRFEAEGTVPDSLKPKPARRSETMALGDARKSA